MTSQQAKMNKYFEHDFILNGILTVEEMGFIFMGWVMHQHDTKDRKGYADFQRKYNAITKLALIRSRL